MAMIGMTSSKSRAMITKGITLYIVRERERERGRGRDDILVHVVLLGLNKSKLCPGKRAASGPDSCTDLGYLSTAEENKFNTAEVEFLPERNERGGKKRGKSNKYRELNTLVQCALEPIGTRRRRGENAMGLGLFNVPLGRLFDLIEGLGV